MRAVVLLVAALLSFALPALAADDVANAQSVIRAQEEAFPRDDAAAAYSYAAPGIRQIFPQADVFMSMVQHAYTPVYRHKSFELARRRRPAARSPSASTSSTTMAKPGRRSIRWSNNPTAA